MSKLISLVLVLAIAGVASAADFYWNSNVASGNYSVMTNWKIGGTATSPLATSTQGYGDQMWARPSLNGSLGATASITINVDVAAYTSRLNINTGTPTLNILDGVTLTNNGTISATGWQFYNTTLGVVNVDGSLLNERGDTTQMTVKIGGSGNGSSNTININDGGIMTVKNTATHNALFAIGNTQTAAGSAYVNIAAGGLLDVDSYTFGLLANKKLKVAYGGLMKVRGDVTTQINGDITAGNIVGAYGNAIGLDVWTKTEGGQVYTYVPEPATVALLGLGSLMLLRRKR